MARLERTERRVNKMTSYHVTYLHQGTVEDYPPEALIDTITPDFSLPDDINDLTKDTDTVEESSSGDFCYFAEFFMFLLRSSAILCHKNRTAQRYTYCKNEKVPI